MTVKTVDRAALTAVGLIIRTKPMSPEIPALWPKFAARIPEIQHPAEPGVSYGVMRSSADMKVLEYMAGISVTSVERIPPGMESIRVPAGAFAEFSYPISSLGKGFAEIFNDLLPASNYSQVPGAYLLERYGEDFDARNPRAPVAILIPVKRK